jgi:hypothetical protein
MSLVEIKDEKQNARYIKIKANRTQPPKSSYTPPQEIKFIFIRKITQKNTLPSLPPPTLALLVFLPFIQLVQNANLDKLILTHLF